jgi:hypothetical protein
MIKKERIDKMMWQEREMRKNKKWKVKERMGYQKHTGVLFLTYPMSL